MKFPLIILSCLLTPALLTGQSTYDQLLEINHEWKKYSYNEAQNGTFEGDTREALIAFHLHRVVEKLNAATPMDITTSAKQSRSRLLAALDAYADMGNFPRNNYSYGTFPVFIDSHGTACAVAYLIITSGHKSLATQISKQFNFAYIADMPQEKLKQWAAEFGFTIEELAWIQPTYAYIKPVPITHVNFRTGSFAYNIIDRQEITGGLLANAHTSMKPFRKSMFYTGDYPYSSTLREEFEKDFLEEEAVITTPSKEPWPLNLYQTPAWLFSVNHEDFRLGINPVLHFEGATETLTDGLLGINTRGFEVEGEIGNKVGFYTFVTDNQGNFPAHVRALTANNLGVFPGEGRTKPFKSMGYDFMSAHGYISFNLIPQIVLQFGQDKNFIGDGYRSLLLSDQGKDYLFLKLRTNVWRISYTNLFTEMVDYREANMADGYVNRKYGAFHYLSFRARQNLFFGLCEGVIFGNPDSTNRGYDFHYLNPVIFYRTVEFQLGSSDNVVVGANFKYNFLRHFQWYGQGVLDEFKFSELKNGTGWWANKFGWQTGLKYYDVFTVPHLDLQVEYNTVRPYTYTHNNTNINYTHYHQPLAHPLGANFREFIGIVRYSPIPRLYLDVKAITARYGADTDSTNWGQNIYLDNTTREMEYGNETGQGIPVNLFLVDASLSYMIKHGAWVDLRLINRQLDASAPLASSQDLYLAVALRLNMTKRDYNY